MPNKEPFPTDDAAVRAAKLLRMEHAVTRCLAEADSESAALRAVIHAICDAEGWECGRYWRVDEQAGVLRFAESWCEPDPTILEFIANKRDAVYGPGVGLAGRAWETGQATWVADIKEDARSLKAAITLETGMRGAFHFPVTAGGKTLGVLAFNSREVREPDARLLQAVRVIGSQIGQFLQRKQAESILRASEEQFRAIFEQAAVGITRVDLNGVLVEVNQKFCEMLGYAREELLGKQVRDITHPGDYGEGVKLREQLKSGSAGSSSGEKRFLRKDGGILWARRTMSKACDPEGSPLYVISIVEDITSRKRGEQLLTLEHAVTRCLAEADSESAALKAVIHAVCETQGWECGRYFSWNDKAGLLRFNESWYAPSASLDRFIEKSRELTYLPAAGLVGEVFQSGQPLWVIDIGKDSRLQKGIARDAGMRGTFLFPVMSAGRPIGVLSYHSKKVREPDERLLQAVGVIGSQVGQFLQRKQAEAVLRNSEERFRGLSNLSSDVYWEQDEQYRFTSFSGSGTDLVNPANLQWIGKKRWEQNYINLSASEWAAHIAVLDARKPFRDLELCRRNTAGESIWVSISGEPVFDSAGRFTGYRGVGKDITARKREEQLLALEHAVTRSLAEADSAPGGLSVVLRAVCETEGWECGRYFAADLEAGVLRFREAWGVRDEEIEHFINLSRNMTYAPGVGLAGRVWQSGQPLWVADVNKDARVSAAGRARESGIHGAFVFPVISDGKTIGVFIFNSREVREPEARLEQAVRVIGSQVAQFLQRKQAEEVTRASNDRFRATFDNAPVGIMHTSIDGDRILETNPKLCEMLGYTRDELLSMSTDDFLDPETVGEDRPKYREQILKGEMNAFSSERRYVRKDGSTIWVSRTVSVARDPAGKPLYFIRIAEDINERKLSAGRRAMEHDVTQVLAEAVTVEEAMPLVLRTICQAQGWTCGARWKWNETEELLLCAETWHATDTRGVAEFVAASRDNPNEAPAWHGVAPGTSSGGVVRRVWFSGASVWFPDVTQQPDFRRGPMAAKAGLRSAFGFPILAGMQPLGVMEFYSREIEQPDEALLRMVRAIGSQIGQFIQRKQAEDKVLHLAQFDTVTGLPNRILFNDRLGLMLAQAQRNDWLLAILFVDLDRFKTINDTYGHAAGDKLLRQVAARLKECLRSSDVVGRLSGDEFALLLSNLAKADDAGLVAQKIVGTLAAPFDLDGQQAYISASIGIALYPSDGREPDTLVRNADTAMYRAKEQGRNGYQFYLPQMNERLKQRLERESQLRVALERDEYRLHYQPKVNLETGAISGFEALLRWEHGGRLVSPAEFIPILEYTGLIVPVGEWVVRSACRQIRHWEEQKLAVRPVAVNLSARQFQSKNLAEVIGAILRETGVAPSLLELELTETLLMSDAEEAVETLRELKALGVRLAVDDFGTGYSSLAYLKRFPLDTLKIDRAFVRDTISDPDDAAIALTIINLAHSLKLKVVAEGVETEAQLSFLCLRGCDEMQGFYFARPLPVEECSKWLAEGRRLQLPQSAAKADLPVLLLLDDNEEELRRLEQALDGEYFRIVTATSPKAAFDILALQGARIVISDHHMPEMTGVEFLARVRKLYPNTVRVVASRSDEAPTLTRATNRAGIHKFLSKTWEPQRLRAEVREAYQQYQEFDRIAER